MCIHVCMYIYIYIYIYVHIYIYSSREGAHALPCSSPALLPSVRLVPHGAAVKAVVEPPGDCHIDVAAILQCLGEAARTGIRAGKDKASDTAA